MPQTPKLHTDILTKKQADMRDVVRAFNSGFCLVGGTALALQIGHRESIDFDLFTKTPDTAFDVKDIQRTLRARTTIDRTLRNEKDELTVVAQDVQLTFFRFDYPIPCAVPFDDVIDMPDILTLAAMKMFALGMRAKWKDYVDLYIVMRDYYSLGEIANRAKDMFGGAFNERLARQQLSYFEDIDYSESVTFRPGFEMSESEIKEGLQELSVGA